MVIYALISTINSCIWSALVWLLGASIGRALFFFIVCWLVMFFAMLFFAGCARCNQEIEEDYRTRFVR